MNTNKSDSRPAFRLYLDGQYTSMVFHGWKNIREAEARYVAKGHTVEWGRA